MAQSLTKISLIAFKMQLPMMTISQLKNLLKSIYELKWSSPNSITDAADLERKETAILKELQGRGYLAIKDRADFQKWIKDMNYKKRTY